MSANNNRNTSERVFVNSAIRVPKVLCINHNNVNLGIIPTSQAMQIAADEGMDLVQVSPPSKDKAPTCRIMDYGKYRYELSKKKKESDKKQRETLVKDKEIWFRPTTDLNDLQTKAKKAEQFISDGCRLRVKIKFVGREMAHKDIAIETLNTFVSLIPNGQFESKPAMEGKLLIVTIGKKTSNFDKHCKEIAS